MSLLPYKLDLPNSFACSSRIRLQRKASPGWKPEPGPGFDSRERLPALAHQGSGGVENLPSHSLRPSGSNFLGPLVS